MIHQVSPINQTCILWHLFVRNVSFLTIYEHGNQILPNDLALPPQKFYLQISLHFWNILHHYQLVMRGVNCTNQGPSIVNTPDHDIVQFTSSLTKRISRDHHFVYIIGAFLSFPICKLNRIISLDFVVGRFPLLGDPSQRNSTLY